jgi:hypothetical protein
MESNQVGTTIILPDLILSSRVNQRWQYSGMDSIDHCLNKDHFRSYPYSIEYVYNSRGFRDQEWPNTLDELKNAIWCFGDSFTVGVGQPFEHTWPQVLSKRLGCKIINVSLDGASNDWIARKVLRVINEIDPKNIVILWSYTHRTELPDSSLTDEDRRCQYSKRSCDQDLQHWIWLINTIKNLNVNAIQATIPRFHAAVEKVNFVDLINNNWNNIKDPSWPSYPSTLTELENLPKHIKEELKCVHQCYELFKWILSPQPTVDSNTQNNSVALLDYVIFIYKQLDWARDGHHFDLLTAEWLVHQMCQQFES